MKLPPDLERRVLELAGLAPAPGFPGEADAPGLVAPGFTPPATWVVPCEVPSLANGRDWRTRNRVAQAHRKAVSRCLGPHLRHLAPLAEHYHRGGVLLVRLVRLGGHRLDRSNLPPAVKYVEDGVALLVGADDGDPRWVASWDQEPGGPCGVRIEITAGDQT